MMFYLGTIRRPAVLIPTRSDKRERFIEDFERIDLDGFKARGGRGCV